MTQGSFHDEKAAHRVRGKRKTLLGYVQCDANGLQECEWGLVPLVCDRTYKCRITSNSSL